MGMKATKIKFIPISGDDTKSPAPVNPLDQDGNMLKPAVTFNANRIAYADGVKVENGEIYETLLNINTDCLATSAIDVQNGVDPKFMANTFAMISRTNADIMINSFCNSLSSHYCVFAVRVNMIIDKLLGDRADSTIRKLDTECAWYNHDRYIVTAIDRLMNCSLEERNRIIQSHALVDFCVGFVNNIGERIYTEAMHAISQALAYTMSDAPAEERTVIPAVNSAFSIMMGDMTYEISAFVYNMETYHNLVFNNREIAYIKYANSPEKNPYSKDYNGPSRKYGEITDKDDPFYMDY